MILIALYFFVLGLIFGSFALAVASRELAGKDWVTARSSCDVCGKTLGFIDLLPVVSWVLAGGRCRHCKKRLSLSYPMSEIILGALFVLSYVVVDPRLQRDWAGLGLFLASLVFMMILFIIDARSMKLLYKFLFPLIVLSLGHAFFLQDVPLPSLVASVAVAAGLFALLWFVSSGRWIGDGDVLFGIAAGLLLADPFVSWLMLSLASVLGLMYGVYRGGLRASRKTKVPFGPFLIIATVVSYLYGSAIVDWYQSAVIGI